MNRSGHMLPIITHALIALSRQWVIRLLLTILYCGLPLSHAISSEQEKQPVYINADSMQYDEKAGLLRAHGKVEIMQGERILLADEVIYDHKTDTVRASGNISLLESNGDVYFSDELQLKDKMRDGIIEQFRAHLSDDSLIASNTAEYIDNKVMKLDNAVYSPCPVCDTTLNDAPQWQIKAHKVVMNKDKQKILYQHAFFELYGVPILYTPYFSHAMPGADRKSGFLIPTYSTISTLGTTLKTPYYWNIKPEVDATITPMYTSKEGMVMAGEMRHLTEYGQYELGGSVTKPNNLSSVESASTSGKPWRGHIEGKGHFNFQNNWHAGFHAKRASDDTYLRRYKFGEEDFLTSRFYTEHIEGRDYLGIQALSFQDLTPNAPAHVSPVVLPLIDWHVEKDGPDASRFLFDVNTRIATRQRGAKSGRLSVKGGWAVPYITQNGHVFRAEGSVRGDTYLVDNMELTQNGTTTRFDGTVSRAIPELRLDWKYPLLKQTENTRIFIEPLANLLVSSRGGNSDKIPNEDSHDVELSDDNLFNSSHFSGDDRVEGGIRTNYGIRTTLDANDGKRIQLLFGQHYRTDGDSSFEEGSGLDTQFSDYVGRIHVTPMRQLDATYYFRLDNKDFSVRRHEVNTAITLKKLSFNANYVSLDEEIGGIRENREEIFGSASMHLSDRWTLTSYGRKDLRKEGKMIFAGGSLLYHGDCADISTLLTREFTRDRDIRPSTSLTFQVFLKNLY